MLHGLCWGWLAGAQRWGVLGNMYWGVPSPKLGGLSTPAVTRCRGTENVRGGVEKHLCCQSRRSEGSAERSGLGVSIGAAAQRAEKGCIVAVEAACTPWAASTVAAIQRGTATAGGHAVAEQGNGKHPLVVPQAHLYTYDMGDKNHFCASLSKLKNLHKWYANIICIIQICVHCDGFT